MGRRPKVGDNRNDRLTLSRQNVREESIDMVEDSGRILGHVVINTKLTYGAMPPTPISNGHEIGSERVTLNGPRNTAPLHPKNLLGLVQGDKGIFQLIPMGPTSLVQTTRVSQFVQQMKTMQDVGLGSTFICHFFILPSTKELPNSVG